jgi:PAS domain S-box-containing protein
MTSQSLTSSYDSYGLAVARPARRSALRHRLPALIFALLGVLGAAFSWMAYAEVVRALRASGADRLVAAGTQVADLLAQAAVARVSEARRLAADEDTRRTVIVGTTTDVPPAAQAFVTRNPLTTVWLYDAAGRLTGALAVGREAPSGPDIVAAASVPPEGIGPLRAQSGRVWYHTTVPIAVKDAGTPSAFLSIQRSVGSAQALGLIERLIGPGADLKIGNAHTKEWTDLSMPVPPPPSTVAGATHAFTTTAGERRVGGAVAVPGTPWLVWVDVPETLILGPAATLLRRMLPITLVLTVLAALAVYGFSGRITRPLEQVAQAAEAIAGGDLTRRVDASRSDEIGRLGTAFNVMVERLARSHEDLEARVRTRTSELEHARNEMDQFFSLTLELLCIAGMDGRFQRVNPAWERVLGWTDADLTSVPYLDLVHPDDRAATEREAVLLSSGQQTLSFENRYRAKDGSYRWLSWKAVPRPERGLIYAVAHDVTEQKRTERALHQHASDLAAANRELEAFSYSVSHDLRAPLRSIDGFAQALVEEYQGQLDETGRNYLARIRAAAQRMGTLIDDLLSLSRVSRQELTRVDLHLTAMARETAARLVESDPSRPVEWRIAPALQARGDARLMRIALDNLLGNAWKFTSKKDGAIIEFGVVDHADGTPAFFVRDNGAGFDPAYASKLFGAFQRLHDDRQYPGTGIGLATVQRVILRHGGRIWAEAAVEQGATFYFTLGTR